MRIIIGLLITVLAFGQGKQNVTWTGLVDAHGAHNIPPTATFASPPGSPETGAVFIFTDASAVGTCSGGGSSLATCRWNGSAYQATGGGGSGGGSPLVTPVAVAPSDTSTTVSYGATIGNGSTALPSCVVTSGNLETQAWASVSKTTTTMVYTWSPNAGFTGFCTAVLGGAAGPAGATGPAGPAGAPYAGCTQDGSNGIVCTGAMTASQFIGGTTFGAAGNETTTPAAPSTNTMVFNSTVHLPQYTKSGSSSVDGTMVAPTTCTNQVITAVPGTGTPTCTTLSSAYLPIVPNTKGGTGADSSAQTGLAKVTSGTWSYVSSIRPIGCIFGDAATGSALTTSETCYVRAPSACTIVGYSILADAGTATVKTWRVATGGTAIPTVSNSISTSGVALSTGTAVYSTTVTDWTSTAIAANDLLAFNLSAVATAKQITFQIDCAQ